MTPEADQLQRQLTKAQNKDGGWGYHQGSSWTEPTALAVLALQACEYDDPASLGGCSWLQQRQRPDGGWAPNPALDTSTCVTSWAVLALSGTALAQIQLRRGVGWILQQMNPEPPPLQRVLCRLLGTAPPKAPGGSPWFPGTAAWIAPTAASVLALSQTAHPALPFPACERAASAISAAQRYILSRQCQDGGWNHGGSPVRSENAESYPEMTGMALLALYGVPGSELKRSLQRAETYLARAQSTEALAWLQLGLMRHGRTVPESAHPACCRTTREICLRLLALAGPTRTNRLFAPPITCRS